MGEAKFTAIHVVIVDDVIIVNWNYDYTSLFVKTSYVRSMKCSVPDRTGKDVQSELSGCKTMQSKCVSSQYRSSK